MGSNWRANSTISALSTGRPDPEAVLGATERHRPTMLFRLPTLYNALVTHPRSRNGICPACGCASRRSCSGNVSNRCDKQVLGASGARVPGYEVRLTDADGQPVARGETGIPLVRGDSQAPCYWNRPEKAAGTMRDSWIWTGDRFREDVDGFFHFGGRADDMAKVSGQWVHPMEVERCLASHPAVHERVVMAVEDEKRLVSLRVWVVLKPELKADDAMTRALQGYAKRNLLPYKCPRAVAYLAEIPKTGTNKVDRQALRALAR